MGELFRKDVVLDHIIVEIFDMLLATETKEY